MFNSATPSPGDLPTSRQLMRSTVIAALSAILLLVTIVLPAEYGIDPTGIGRVLGLTEMGETKTRLAREAADEAAASASLPPAARGAAPAPALPATEQPAPAPPPTEQPVAPAIQVPAAPPTVPGGAAPAAWRDEVSFILKPGEGTEIKLSMNAGDKATYAWAVQGGVVNYDTHGDGGGRSISYEKGRGVPSDEGELQAAFTGNHGWFWRNRGQADVKVVLRTGGTYRELKRLK